MKLYGEVEEGPPLTGYMSEPKRVYWTEATYLYKGRWMFPFEIINQWGFNLWEIPETTFRELLELDDFRRVVRLAVLKNK